MKLQPMKMRTFFMLAALCVAVALLAEHYPAVQMLEYVKWGLVAWLAVDVVVSVLPAGWLVRAPRASDGMRWSANLFEDALAQGAEPHRFNLIGDPSQPWPEPSWPDTYIGEFMPRGLEEVRPIDYHVEVPSPTDALIHYGAQLNQLREAAERDFAKVFDELPVPDPEALRADIHRTWHPGQRGRAEAIRDSAFGKRMSELAFNALAGTGPDTGHLTRGIVPDTGTAAALIREVEAKHGTLRQTDPDGTVTETTTPVSDNGEVHMLDVAFKPADGHKPVFFGMDFAREPGVSVGIDTVLPPVEYGPEALADLRNHGVAYHRVGLDDAGALRFEHAPVAEVQALVMGQERLEVHVGPLQWGGDDELERELAKGGMVVSGTPSGPIAKVDYDPRALRLLRPDPVGDSRAKHRSRYWEYRYDAQNPEITEDELQRRLLDRPTDAASVRKAVAAVTNELRTYAPPSLQLTGPAGEPAREADGSAMGAVQDVKHLAMVRVADVGALAVSLAVDNDHLRNELNASMAMRQEASRQLAAMDLNEDGRHPSEDLGAMSRADAKKLCIAMGWLIQQETVAVWAEPSDYD